ncbi:unnamed protein product [Alternaria alternata]
MRDVEKSLPEPAFAKEWPPSSAEDVAALPNQHRLAHSPHLRPITQEHAGIPYNFHSSHFHQSLPRPLQRTVASSGRPSSKRRKEHDHVREEEIRAMSFPMPQKRPAANSGGMLRRDSKKVEGALNHRFERPTSNVSLPLENSIHSSMSGNSENRAFRPENSTRRPISSSADEKASRRTSRIDDLADELDAGALRDILERDKRRREKKAKADQEASEVQRRAEKQNAMKQEERLPLPARRVQAWLVLLPTPLESPTEEPVVSNAREIRYSKGSASAHVHTRGPSNASILPELISEKLANDMPVDSIEHGPDPTRSGSLHPIDTTDTFATSKPGSSTRRRS